MSRRSFVRRVQERARYCRWRPSRSWHAGTDRRRFAVGTDGVAEGASSIGAHGSDRSRKWQRRHPVCRVIAGRSDVPGPHDPGRTPPTIVVSADVQSMAAERVMKLGALAFLKKSVNQAELADVLKRAG